MQINCGHAIPTGNLSVLKTAATCKHLVRNFGIAYLPWCDLPEVMGKLCCLAENDCGTILLIPMLQVAYSLEGWENYTRHNFNAIVSPRDLADSYLPAFHQCISKGRPAQVMCSYSKSLSATSRALVCGKRNTGLCIGVVIHKHLAQIELRCHQWNAFVCS